MSSIERLIEEWDGLAVIAHHDQPTGSWFFVALHDNTLGTPLGGCRMRSYPTPADGLRDAMRLAEGMTHKWATIGLGYGGGKSVLAVPKPLEGEERTGLLRRFGALLNALNGSYLTGEDLGTTPRDMEILARETPYVHGVDRETGRARDPGPFTALGVFTAIRTALEHALGDGDLAGRRVLIQGVGDVGAPLARLLIEAGAEVLVSDLDDDRAERVAAEIGGRVVAPERVYDEPCDVFAPCAIGGTLNERTISRLRCRVVAGSANNQLGEAADADRLHERGILYAPDYVANSGGAIAFGFFHEGADEAEVRRRIDGIAGTLAEIFREAAARGESPLHAARRRVERILRDER